MTRKPGFRSQKVLTLQVPLDENGLSIWGCGSQVLNQGVCEDLAATTPDILYGVWLMNRYGARLSWTTSASGLRVRLRNTSSTSVMCEFIRAIVCISGSHHIYTHIIPARSSNSSHQTMMKQPSSCANLIPRLCIPGAPNSPH